MWPLPEPTRPEGAEQWDPPVLVRLPLDHGCDEQRERAQQRSQPRPAPWGTRTASRRP